MTSKRKALGQHFLHDQNIVRKILAEAAIGPDETVVEIGPGRGILTHALARCAAAVYAVEIDRALYEQLTRDVDASPVRAKVHLIHSDALDYPFENLPAPFAVVANLPYSVSTPLLFRLLSYNTRVTRMVLMLQLEVARRITAAPGTKDYSPLTIGAQYHSDARLAFVVPRGCFSPPPKVDSAVIHLTMRATPRVAVKNEELFFRVVRAGFGHRRKSLRNALKDGGFPAEAVEQALSASAVIDGNPRRRAETLTMEEFGRLSDRLLEATITHRPS